ncbi:MAG: EcsC family protein [Trueperaceae bacterium]
MPTARTPDHEQSAGPTPEATAPRVSPFDANVLVHRLLRYGLGGHKSLASSKVLAAKYAANLRFADDDARVRALIRSHTLMNFGTGFATGLGGLITLPVAIPAAMTASWAIHTRLSGAIAALHGHDVDDDRVQTFVLMTLLGDTGKSVLRKAGITVANRMALRSVEAIPVRLLTEINKRVGMRLIAKAGERGAINLTKAVPVAGGVVGGGIDALYCNAVGRRAHAVFKPEGPVIT